MEQITPVHGFKKCRHMLVLEMDKPYIHVQSSGHVRQVLEKPAFWIEICKSSILLLGPRLLFRHSDTTNQTSQFNELVESEDLGHIVKGLMAVPIESCILKSVDVIMP